MSFKKTALLCLTLLLAGSVGCSLRIGERAADKSNLEVSDGQLACLTGASKRLVEAVTGESDNTQIAALWDCAARSLKTFSERARGSVPGVYSPKELRNFVQRYFLKGEKISDGLLAEFMEIKRSFLGGSVDKITIEEIYQFNNLLSIIRDQNIRLRPYLPLTAEKYASASVTQLEAAVDAFEGVAIEMGKVLRGTGYEYRFSNLRNLLLELENASISDEFTHAMHTLRMFLPAFQQIKAILISPDPTRIASQEWEYLLSTSTRWYGLYLRYAYARQQDPSWVHGAGRENLVKVVQDLLWQIQKAVDRHPDKMISFMALDALFDALDPSFLKFAGLEIKPAHVKAFLRPLVQRLLSGARLGPDGRTALGIRSAHLQHGWDLLEDWSEGQRFIDLLFERLGARTAMGPGSMNPEGSLERQRMLGQLIEDVFGVPKKDIPKVTWDAASRIRLLLAGQRPFFHGDGMEMDYHPGLSPEQFYYHDLTMMNLSNALARMLSTSYAEEPARTEVGVTKAEFEHFYQDLRDIGIDLKVLDPENKTVAAKRFMESNIFTFVGNGNALLEIAETAELITFMASSKHLSIRMHERIAAICNLHEPQPVPVDILGGVTVNAECYRTELYSPRNQDLWERVPLLFSYVRGLSPRDFQDFVRNIEDASRRGGFTQNRVTTLDSDSLAGIFHYIENVFSRFDRNQDGYLMEAEMFEGNDPAFPIYRSVLAEASCIAGTCLESDSSLGLLFTFLLDHGRVPTGAEFVLWYFERPFVTYQADRGRFVQIMAELAKALRPKTAPNQSFSMQE